MKRLIETMSLAALTAAICGCGLFEDATTLTVDTDWMKFSVDASSLGLTASGATVPAIPCTGLDICAQASSQFSCGGGPYQCSLVCGGGGNCEANATVEQAVPVDISKRVGNQTSASALSKVSLKNIPYNTLENTLNFSTPRLTFYVGPEGATTSGDAGVVKLGTFEPLGPGEKRNEDLVVEEAGKAALAAFVKDFKKPFALLVGGDIKIEAGQALPTGILSMQMKAYFQVSPL